LPIADWRLLIEDRNSNCLGYESVRLRGINRKSAILMLALLLGGLSCPPALAWGPKAHRLANDWAVETLSPEIRGFFQAYRQYLVEHANDPDEWIKKDRYESMRHYIYLDRYGRFPYLTLPHSYKEARQRLGSSRMARNGVLPWQIGEYSLRMTNALKIGNWDEARLDAAVLGHYVADAHDPLNTTENYDGQLVQQTGLATRFGVALIDRYANFFMVRPGDAVKIEDPTEYAFQTVLEANTLVDRVIWTDRRSREGLVDYNDDYFDRFYTQIGSTAARAVSEAAHDIGSYWYTAWLNAGRPAPPGAVRQ
jgi:hypothetical protein